MNLDQLIVDQATGLRIQPAFDVFEERLVEVMEQILIGGQVALIEYGELEVDLETVDVPADKERFGQLKLPPLI